MNPALFDLAARYGSDRDPAERARDAVTTLYAAYMRKREASVLEAAAAAAALVAITPDGIDFDALTPQLEEAFSLAYPNVPIADLATRDHADLAGFVNGWKGKYFEVIVRDKLNAGEAVGDLQLRPGQIAALADSPTQPGWDLVILNDDGTAADLFQLKATKSLQYVKDALERYPGIEIIATDDVAGATEDVLASGITDEALSGTVSEPLADLTDSVLSEVADVMLPGLPFLVIGLSETRMVLAGRKAVHDAMASARTRGFKTVAAIAAGALVTALEGPVAAAPAAAMITRLGIDRVQVMKRIRLTLDARIAELTQLAESYEPAKRHVYVTQGEPLPCA